MAKNAFHTSKGIGATASIMAANVARTSAAMSSISPLFDSGARGGSVDFGRIPRERVSAISFHHYVDDRCHQQTNCDGDEEDPCDFAKKLHRAAL
jgi:hypothetical protein